jgi:hypothetical protein
MMLPDLVPAVNQAAAQTARAREIPVAETGATPRRAAQPISRRGAPSRASVRVTAFSPATIESSLP